MILAGITGTLEELPGLLVLVPAAIGLRGNVFSALGNRLSTSIHVGTFRFSARRDSILVQNLAAALVLTIGMSLLLAVAARVLAVALAVPGAASLGNLALVSILGGTLASLVVLAATLTLTLGAVRYEWDLDNLVAPVVSTLGDVVTLPALWLAAELVGVRVLAPSLTWLLVLGTMVAMAVTWRSRLGLLRQIIRQSLPVLTAAALLSTLAGLTLQQQLDTFLDYKALFLLELAFVSSIGALGGIFSSRLATAFQLGTIEPVGVPGRAARVAGLGVLALAAPVMVLNAVGAELVAGLFGQSSPGLGSMLALSLVAGAIVMVFVCGVAYFGTLAAYRVGLDPDTYGVPVVTSSVDFGGALVFVVTIVSLGIAAT
ncbi:MAG: hypothetical protein GEV08_03215 [Acidimicrobiia bacterium]|nr:hypothetical protein [Acidimicrobiia bacterium]